MPESNSLVVVNSTPIIALSLLGHLDLLRQLYMDVAIPEAVRDEVLKGGSTNVGVRELRDSQWLQVLPILDRWHADLLSDLDRGEAEALVLASERRARLVVLDERMARRHAQRLGLVLTGTLGVLLRAKSQGLIPSVGPLIDQLLEGGFRLSTSVVNECLSLAGELKVGR